MVVVLGLAAAVLYGTGDFLGGLATRRAQVLVVLTLAETASVLIALPAAAMSPGPARLAGLAWGLSAGLVGGLGLIIFYTGLAAGPMSVVAPVSGLVSTVLPVAVALAEGERPGSGVYAGALLCLAAVVLISCGGAAPPPARRRQGPRLRHRIGQLIRPVLPPDPESRAVRSAVAGSGRANRRAHGCPGHRGSAAAQPATARRAGTTAPGGSRRWRDRRHRQYLLRRGNQDRHVRPCRRAGRALPGSHRAAGQGGARRAAPLGSAHRPRPRRDRHHPGHHMSACGAV